MVILWDRDKLLESDNNCCYFKWQQPYPHIVIYVKALFLEFTNGISEMLWFIYSLRSLMLSIFPPLFQLYKVPHATCHVCYNRMSHDCDIWFFQCYLTIFLNSECTSYFSLFFRMMLVCSSNELRTLKSSSNILVSLFYVVHAKLDA